MIIMIIIILLSDRNHSQTNLNNQHNKLAHRFLRAPRMPFICPLVNNKNELIAIWLDICFDSVCFLYSFIAFASLLFLFSLYFAARWQSTGFSVRVRAQLQIG